MLLKKKTQQKPKIQNSMRVLVLDLKLLSPLLKMQILTQVFT